MANRRVPDEDASLYKSRASHSRQSSQGRSARGNAYPQPTQAQPTRRNSSPQPAQHQPARRSARPQPAQTRPPQAQPARRSVQPQSNRKQSARRSANPQTTQAQPARCSARPQPAQSQYARGNAPVPPPNRSYAYATTTPNPPSSKKPLVIVGAIIIVVVVIAVVIFGLRGCSGNTSSSDTSSTTSTTIAANIAEANESASNTNSNTESTQSKTIDEDALIKALGDDPDFEYNKLMTLADSEPGGYEFVAGVADNYPAAEGEPCTEAITPGEVPLLLQWDKRWGYTQYCSSVFGLTGCGPTTMAMVYQGLTGKNDLTPYDFGQFAIEDGYMLTYDGTALGFFTTEGSRFGITCTELDVDESALVSALQGGAVVICNVAPGDFTQLGHFIVLAGLDSNGDLIVNDPYSPTRSAERWGVSRVIGQTRALFSYTL